MKTQSNQFAKDTLITFITGIFSLLIGLPTSMIIARSLGPTGQGIYTLTITFSSLIVTFINFGIGPATCYYVARNEFKRPQLLGNNILIGASISLVGLLIGLSLLLLFRQQLFPQIPQVYLFMILILIPMEIYFYLGRFTLLGALKIKHYNYVEILRNTLFFVLVVLIALTLKLNVSLAIAAFLLSWFIATTLTLHLALKSTGGVEFKPNWHFIKQALIYGLQVHIMNILFFLNSRADIFLINWFLDPSAVGFYGIGVGLVEKLWLISYAASTVLFPTVAAQKSVDNQQTLTPFVTRSVLLSSAIGAFFLLLFSHWLVILLYSETFIPSVSVIKILLIGIVSLSAGKVLSNDISARGFPKLNIYIGATAVLINIILNLLLIPLFGIAGAAWASTISYTASFLLALLFFCRISGHRPIKVILPKAEDFHLYFHIIKTLFTQACDRLKLYTNSAS